MATARERHEAERAAAMAEDEARRAEAMGADAEARAAAEAKDIADRDAAKTESEKATAAARAAHEAEAGKPIVVTRSEGKKKPEPPGMAKKVAVSGAILGGAGVVGFFGGMKEIWNATGGKVWDAAVEGTSHWAEGVPIFGKWLKIEHEKPAKKKKEKHH